MQSKKHTNPIAPKGSYKRSNKVMERHIENLIDLDVASDLRNALVSVLYAYGDGDVEVQAFTDAELIERAREVVQDIENNYVDQSYEYEEDANDMNVRRMSTIFRGERVIEVTYNSDLGAFPVGSYFIYKGRHINIPRHCRTCMSCSNVTVSKGLSLVRTEYIKCAKGYTPRDNGFCKMKEEVSSSEG